MSPLDGAVGSPWADFLAALRGRIPDERIYTDATRRLAYGTDASFYRLVPQVVVKVESEDEVALVLRAARERRLGVTFRAAGTSLSGQAVTDSVLVLLGDNWRGHQILDGGARIRLQPGVVGARANALLAPHGRKIGPDPASIATCKIGGIAANNASGMCCGTRDNSYHTLDAMRLMLADGSLLDTADPVSVADFHRQRADLLAGLTTLSQQVKANAPLADTIRRKYRIKNTTGYGLNALLDFDDPVEMLTHLMIGSEGTLGFLSAITYRTVPEHAHKASALVLFDALEPCCRAVTALKSAPVAAVELVDRRSLAAVADKLPEVLVSTRYTAALLIETRAENAATLQQQIATIDGVLAGFPVARHTGFSTEPTTTDRYWNVRKGLFPAVGAVRPVGTTVVIEDVAFPIERLADGVAGLQALFDRFGYDEALLFGHALEGNLHFVFTPRFDTAAEVDRYRRFMDAVAQLVAVDFGGSLKAEHGTGRNMAPFVELEWGAEAYAVMQRIKALFDPDGVLNPGVILNDNPQTHVENLKPMPAADPLVDRCIECGFCEPACPASGLTLSPRQRIVMWREIQSLRASGNDAARLAELERDYRYLGIDTCAATGMCATRCPVDINTGELMKQLRGPVPHPGRATWAADRYRLLTRNAGRLLSLYHLGRRLLGTATTRRLNRTLRGDGHTVPLLPMQMPKAARSLPTPRPNGDPVVLFPSCVNRVLAGNRGKASELEATLSLLAKAGFAPRLPADADSLCCGQPFDSKNAEEAARHALAQTEAALLAASDDGRIPVYLDNGPCALRLIDAQRAGQLSDKLQLHAAPGFLARFVTSRLNISAIDHLTLHVPCSVAKLGEAGALLQLAKQLAHEVTPSDVACCGFAGDKGFTTPELNAHALRDLPNRQAGCACGASASRTCQIGLTEHGGIPYDGIEVLLDRQSQAPP